MNKAKAEFFDSQVNSEWATKVFDKSESHKLERFFRMTELAPGMRVLEPGCGTGRLTELLAEKVGAGGSVVATEISAAMLAAATERLKIRGNVQVIHSPVEQYLDKQGRFDRIICHNVFPHFDHKKAVTRQMAEALIADGKFIVFHFGNSEWVNDLHRKTSPVVQNDMLPDKTEMMSILEHANLELESIHDDDLGYLLISRLRSTF